MRSRAIRRALLTIMLATLVALPALAEDPEPETPEDREIRMKVLENKVRIALDDVLDPDVVKRGNALEAILEAGPDLAELKIEGLVEKVRESGITANDRFVAVMAGTILNTLDPEESVAWLRQNAFGSNAPGQTRIMGLAMISEIRREESGKLAAGLASGGPVATRVNALIALAKLRLESTYPVLISALSSTEQEVKDNAAIALGELGDPRAIPALLGHLEDASGDHPAFAAWALRQFEGRPEIFAAVAERLGSESGEPGDAKARIIESCAMPEHVDKLRGILSGSRSLKFRSAAALALGRFAEGNLEAQELLLAGLQKGKDSRVRFACFFGLSKNLSPELGPEIIKGLRKYSSARSDDQHRIFRCLAFLAGDLGLGDAAPLLLNSAMLHKNELTWRIAAVNFWKCAGREMTRKVQQDFDRMSDDRQISRLADIFGRSTREEEFQFLTRQLKRFNEGSAACFAVELGLEHMTGHFFGPDYSIWRHWYEKNPDFFKPRAYRIDRRKWQKEFDQKAREFRQTEETERAVQLGLAWISRHVSLQGALDANKFFDSCGAYSPGCTKEGSRHMIDQGGTTALGALAFLGGGYSPEKGKYKDSLRRLLTYIEVRQTADGQFRTTDRFQGYGRPIALYALAEAYNVSGNDRYRPYLRRGIDFFVEIQNEAGGWHYQASSRETDTSVMSWVLLGLGVAQKSGFEVRESIKEGCDWILDRFSDRVTAHREEFLDVDPHYAYDVGKTFRGEYQTGYQGTVSENATTCFGLMSRMFMGWRRSHPFCIGSAYFILEHNMERIPKADNWSKYVSANRFPSYAWYYGTLAMHQMGGHFFRRWNEVIKKLLPGIQLKEGCDAGSWKVINYDFVGGKVYSTCMGVLTLETYYRYKPFCEEGVPEEEEDK